MYQHTNSHGVFSAIERRLSSVIRENVFQTKADPKGALWTLAKNPLARFLSLAFLFLAGPLPMLQAAIIPDGDVRSSTDYSTPPVPSNPNDWLSTTYGYVGYLSNGNITVNGQSELVCDGGHIGWEMADGTVSVTGGGSTWNANYIELGHGGSGQLSITGGGIVNTADRLSIGTNGSNISTGIVTVDGDGSTLNASWLEMGDSDSHGLLNIMNGGKVLSEASLIGMGSDWETTVNVNGTGSSWTVNGLEVGSDSKGILNITNGGAVYSNDVHVSNGEYGVGIVTVDGNSEFTGTDGQGALISIGGQGGGEMNITHGGTVKSVGCTIGEQSGWTGIVTVDGSNSQLTGYEGAEPEVVVGMQGKGRLDITNGGTVTSIHSFVGWESGAQGVVTVDGTDSKWIALNQISLGQDGEGKAIIKNGGVARSSEVDVGSYSSSSLGVLVIDGADSQLIGHDETGTFLNVAGNGRVDITNGAMVNCAACNIGGYSEAKSVLTVDGSNSYMTGNNQLGTDLSLDVNGRLNIINGGTIIGNEACIGGSKTVATVDGSGSTWICNNISLLGNDEEMNIRGGGNVTVVGEFLTSSYSRLTIDAGTGSLLNINDGAGSIYHFGTVRVLAGAKPVADGSTYAPIAAGWSEEGGIYQGVGGRWDSDTHTFAVSQVQAGHSGQQVQIDLADKQRILVDDVGQGKTGWVLGASFLAMENSETVTLTSTAINGLSMIEEERVLGAWNFAFANGFEYEAGSPAYLSFGVGENRLRNDLHVWRYSDGAWSAFDATDFNYDGTYANFTVTDFNNYAVTMVPEPGPLTLLFAAGLTSLGLIRRKR